MLQKNNINSSTYKESKKQMQYVPLPSSRVLQVPAGSSSLQIPGLVSCQAEITHTRLAC